MGRKFSFSASRQFFPTARWLFLWLFLLAMLLASSAAGWWERTELALYDTWFHWRGAQPVPEDIVLVGIDDRSISQLGRLETWPRRYYADLLDRLANARLVAFDIVFDTPGEEKDTARLAEAIARHGRVVLASMFSYRQEGGAIQQEAHFPLPELAAGATGFGFVNTPRDLDGVLRSITAVDVNYFQRPFPCLALGIWLAEKGLTPDNLGLLDSATRNHSLPVPEAETTREAGREAQTSTSTQSTAAQATKLPAGVREADQAAALRAGRAVLAAGDLRLPLGPDGRLLIDFYGPAGTFPTYSFVDVLQGRVPADRLAGKTVLVGVTAAALHDDVPTPFTRGNLVLDGALPLPGVEVHASALATLRAATPCRRAPLPLNLAWLALLTLAGAGLTGRAAHPLRATALVLLLLAAAGGLTYALWLKGHLWLNLAAPAGGALLAYVAVTAANLLRTELERRRTRALFARYVPPAVVEELLQRPEEIRLGGQRMEVSVLFADIRGFTAFSAGRSPEAIVSRLNEYFTAMTEVIFHYGGTLDKYLGDGLMAFFGAPVPYADHADRALAAARAMRRRLAELNREWTARGEVAFALGVGISAGEVVVGNIGSPERMDYTIIGSTVNLASRLEGLNKEYGTGIIFDRSVYEHLQHPVEAGTIRSLGPAAVRGLNRPVEIYTCE